MTRDCTIPLIRDFSKDAIVASGLHISYREMLQRISLYATAYESLDGGRVLIVSENRAGYIYAFFSVWLNGGVAVPVDFQSDAEELLYVLNDCSPSGIWASPSVLGTVNKALQAYGRPVPVYSVGLYERTLMPEGIQAADIRYEGGRTAAIVYTSGTQGSPKGVMLSFDNLLTNVDFVSNEVRVCTPERRALVLLPLHHIFPLVATMLVPLVIGAGVAISPSWYPEDIIRAMQEGRVGMLIGVPELWKSLYEEIMKKVNASAFSRLLYTLCGRIDSTVFSRIVFHKVHKYLGGCLKACPSGGAALDRKVWRGMKTLGIEIIEGYGMTECGPLISFNRPGDSRPGCVGRPMASCKLRIDDGEICVKGPNVMLGYYNRPEDTQAVIDADGWLHTGDLGYQDADGCLYVTGRKKEIIVLANGKKFNPEELEAKLLQQSAAIRECAVFQYSDRLCAILCTSDSDVSGLSAAVERYNRSVPAYKRISRVFLSRSPLPRTRLDKLRRKLLEAFSSNCEVIMDSAGFEDVITGIREYFNRHSECAEHLLLDSFALLKFQYYLENRFGLTVSQTEIADCDTLESLSKMLESHLNDSAPVYSGVQPSGPSTSLRPMGRLGWMSVVSTRWISGLFFGLEFVGIDNIPSDGPFIMVSNHQSYLDTLFIMQGLTREEFGRMTFLAKEEHVRNRIARFLARRHRVVVLRRDNIKDGVDELATNIRAGACALIFPEGTRTEDGSVGPFKPTFADLSLKLNVPVLPVFISGAFEALPKGSHFPKRSKVKVSFLPPVHPLSFANPSSSALSAVEFASRIRELICAEDS